MFKLFIERPYIMKIVNTRKKKGVQLTNEKQNFVIDVDY